MHISRKCKEQWFDTYIRHALNDPEILLSWSVGVEVILRICNITYSVIWSDNHYHMLLGFFKRNVGIA